MTHKTPKKETSGELSDLGREEALEHARRRTMERRVQTLDLTKDQWDYVKYAVRRTVKDDIKHLDRLKAKMGDSYDDSKTNKTARIELGKRVREKMRGNGG